MIVLCFDYERYVIAREKPNLSRKRVECAGTRIRAAATKWTELVVLVMFKIISNGFWFSLRPRTTFFNSYLFSPLHCKNPLFYEVMQNLHKKELCIVNQNLYGYLLIIWYIGHI